MGPSQELITSSWDGPFFSFYTQRGTKGNNMLLEESPVEDIKDIPTYSYDLIDKLDEITPTPALPKTAKGWTVVTPEVLNGYAYQAGYRACVDTLIALRDEQEDEHAERTGARPDDAAKGGDGPLSHVRSVSIGGFDELGLREVEPLLDNYNHGRAVSGGSGLASPSDPDLSSSDDDARRLRDTLERQMADEESPKGDLPGT